MTQVLGKIMCVIFYFGNKFLIVGKNISKVDNRYKQIIFKEKHNSYAVAFVIQ